MGGLNWGNDGVLVPETGDDAPDDEVDTTFPPNENPVVGGAGRAAGGAAGAEGGGNAGAGAGAALTLWALLSAVD